MNIRKSVSTTLFICLIYLLFIGNMSGKTIESENRLVLDCDDCLQEIRINSTSGDVSIK